MAARAFVFEEHAGVLPHWAGCGLREATLVCFDAHLDLQFIGAPRIARLQACGGPQELRLLASAHPLSPRRDACYGIEDFLYAAARLGLVRRLVWVAPPHVLAAAGAARRALQQMEGVTPQELASLRRVPGGWIEGRLLGVPIAILGWELLRAFPLEGPLALDVDADYFVQVPGDRPWLAPPTIVDLLKARAGGGAQELTIARSVDSGFLPLRHRWLADHLAAAWEGRDEEARCWDRLFAVETGSAPRAPLLRELADERPGCAALWHALAMETAEPAQRDAFLARAVALDAHYAPDLLRDIAGLRARGRPPDLAGVLRLHKALAAWRGPAERVAAAWVALGLLYADFGRLREAIGCDAASRLQGRGHPDLALRIGGLELAAGRPAAAEPWLQDAAADDETRVAAWLQLSARAWALGDRKAAAAWAGRASEAAPAWPDPAPWLTAHADGHGRGAPA